MNLTNYSLTSAEASAIMAGNEAISAIEAQKTGLQKVLVGIAKRRYATGLSEADIYEALAEGCETNDVMHWQYRVMEYLNRYATKYGATLVIIVGIIMVVNKIREYIGVIGSAVSAGGLAYLASTIFGSRDTAEKKSDARACVMRDALFSTSDAGMMADTFTNGLTFMLPPFIGAGVASVVREMEKGTKQTQTRPSSGSALANLGQQAGSSIGGGIGSVAGSTAGAVYETLHGLGILDERKRDSRVRDMRVRDSRVRDRRSGNRPNSLGIARPII